jgi:hypothetical protein
VRSLTRPPCFLTGQTGLSLLLRGNCSAAINAKGAVEWRPSRREAVPVGRSQT